MRWRSRPGPNAPEEVTGIVVLETVPSVPGSRYPHKIETVYSEFNSGAWLVDLGKCSALSVLCSMACKANFCQECSCQHAMLLLPMLRKRRR